MGERHRRKREREQSGRARDQASDRRLDAIHPVRPTPNVPPSHSQRTGVPLPTSRRPAPIPLPSHSVAIPLPAHRRRQPYSRTSAPSQRAPPSLCQRAALRHAPAFAPAAHGSPMGARSPAHNRASRKRSIRTLCQHSAQVHDNTRGCAPADSLSRLARRARSALVQTAGAQCARHHTVRAFALVGPHTHPCAIHRELGGPCCARRGPPASSLTSASRLSASSAPLTPPSTAGVIASALDCERHGPPAFLSLPPPCPSAINLAAVDGGVPAPALPVPARPATSMFNPTSIAFPLAPSDLSPATYFFLY
ncbi:hypothetical protein PLICRDRAFT_180727 [Plicaturopsis crispa FD-325 SS-3]|uniref:Uncharacterized protein n=1 Tax=Plicaturopsis crispa FD-325 SS-3 TaxID=944288 RepID=A0A0C9T1Q5_PLICR|nr:hypothetical protein PLICRDRAFT_180727 [Plicaturopsis crispa FD-325 SS-3]